MAEHTPTPWAVETIKVEPDLGELMLVKQVGGKKGDPYIADTFVGMEGGAKRSKEECEANAAFIVRAANAHDALLAACRRALAELEGRPTSMDDIRLQLEAAIILATA